MKDKNKKSKSGKSDKEFNCSVSSRVNDPAGGRKIFLGVDVGGTKTLAVVAYSSGEIISRRKVRTPRGLPPAKVLDTIIGAMEKAMVKSGLGMESLAAVGLAFPGVVNPVEGRIVVTANMNLSGIDVVSPVKKRFAVPVALGNDVNVGTLGEKWLGAGKDADNVVGIFVGTGIGGGIISQGRLINGAFGYGGEIGHIVMDMGGPKCGCGNRGCLETLASRTAMEREIKKAVSNGKKTILTDIAGSELKSIRSKMLSRALKEKDKLTIKIIRKASQILGHACLTVRHLFDPDIIILGGGVVEACEDFILPIVQKVVNTDRFMADETKKGMVVPSRLGDDAVVLGAVAMAKEMVKSQGKKIKKQ